MLEQNVATRIHARVNILVDYDLPFDKRIATGQFDKVDERITPERFPLVGFSAVLSGVTRIPRVALLRVGSSEEGPITEEDILRRSASRELRQTSLEELIAFGATQHTVLASTTIIALAARCVIDGIEYVACCNYGGYVRSLGLTPVAEINWKISNQAVLVAESEE